MLRDFKEKVAELLMKYLSGFWVSVFLKVFEDTYKVKFFEDVLKNFVSFFDVCIVDYIFGNF